MSFCKGTLSGLLEREIKGIRIFFGPPPNFTTRNHKKQQGPLQIVPLFAWLSGPVWRIPRTLTSDASKAPASTFRFLGEASGAWRRRFRRAPWVQLGVGLVRVFAASAGQTQIWRKGRLWSQTWGLLVQARGFCSMQAIWRSSISLRQKAPGP